MSESDVTSGFTSDTSSALSADERKSEQLTNISNSSSHVDDDTESSNSNHEKDAIIEHDETESCEVSDNEEEKPKTEAGGKWEDILGSGSLMKFVVTEGTPNTRPQRLQNCRISYECTLEDGTLVEKNDNFELQLGDCEVVQGLDLALGLMNVGEVCKLKIEPRLAYGHKGLKPTIPPDTNVVFEVKLLSVDYEDEPESLNIHERRLRGNKKRERGNWWYSRGENQLAIQCYRRALDYLDEVEGGIKTPLPDGEVEVTDAALQQLLEDRINVSNNMAAAQLKLELYDAALQSLQTVLRCQPDNVKALFRKAKVYRAKNDVQAAINCLRRAQKVLPNDSDILRELNSLEKIKERQKKSEKELARRMFNGLQNDVQNSSKNKNSTKLLTWATVGASVAVGIVGLAIYRFKFM